MGRGRCFPGLLELGVLPHQAADKGPKGPDAIPQEEDDPNLHPGRKHRLGFPGVKVRHNGNAVAAALTGGKQHGYCRIHSAAQLSVLEGRFCRVLAAHHHQQVKLLHRQMGKELFGRPGSDTGQVFEEGEKPRHA